MPDIDLELTQVTENANGTFNVYIRAVRAVDSSEVANKQFTAENIIDLKDQIRPRYETLLDEEARKKTLEAAAIQALTELMNEVTP